MRRTLVLLCVVLGAAAVWLAAPALSLQPHVPRAVDFELPVNGPGGARAAKAAWTSPVLRAPKRFDLLGLRWERARGEVHAEVRTRRTGGRWSPWTETGTAHAVRGTDPVWAGGADELQLRLERRVVGLRVHFVNTTGTATPLARRVTAARAAMVGAVRWAFAAPTARAAAKQPTIVSRAEWGAEQCRPREAPATGEVHMAFVHHTVSTNAYGPEDSRDMVLAICRYHRNGNGWDDIGYNFLVDKYGTIFEGREGGIDQAVVGAQAQGYNAVSTGVANLGDYQGVPQSDAALQSIARLLAWKLPLHGAPVTGEVTVSSAGGTTNRHPKGRSVTFQRITGHRDGNNTECPGRVLYDQLPRLRAMTAQRAPAVGTPTPVADAPQAASLTLAAAERRLTAPATARLDGRLRDEQGRPVAGSSVALQMLTARGFRTVRRVRTASDGAFSGAIATRRNRVYRAAQARGDGGYLVSPTVSVRVAPGLASAAPARMQAGGRLVVTGTVQPRKTRLVVTADRQRGDDKRRFVRAARVRVAAARDGAFRARVPLRRAGRYRVRVSFAGDGLNAASRAPDLLVRAVRRFNGGAAARAAR